MTQGYHLGIVNGLYSELDGHLKSTNPGRPKSRQIGGLGATADNREPPMNRRFLVRKWGKLGGI